MALPKKVLVDLDLLIDIFEYLNRLGDDDAFKLCDKLLVKFEALVRREDYAAKLRKERNDALDEWLRATETEKEG